LHKNKEAVSKVKKLANLVIPNLFRDLIYNTLGSWNKFRMTGFMNF